MTVPVRRCVRLTPSILENQLSCYSHSKPGVSTASKFFHVNDKASISASSWTVSRQDSDLSRDPSLVYVAFYSITVLNDCGLIKRTFNTFIGSFGPSKIQTIEKQGTVWSTGPYDFTDLPCGPPGMNSNGLVYSPNLAPPSGLLSQMNITGCTDLDLSLFPDKMKALHRVQGVNPPHPPGIHHGRIAIRKAAATAHRVPRTAQKTTAPT